MSPDDLDEGGSSLYDATIRIVCDAPSHADVVVATYQHFVGDGRPLAPNAQRWHWREALSYGGGAIQPESGQRLTTHKRRATPGERLRGWRWDEIESGPKRVVADPNQTSDVLECAKCGLRRLVNRDKLEALLERSHDGGVSSLRLGDLVARLR